MGQIGLINGGQADFSAHDHSSSGIGNSTSHQQNFSHTNSGTYNNVSYGSGSQMNYNLTDIAGNLDFHPTAIITALDGGAIAAAFNFAHEAEMTALSLGDLALQAAQPVNTLIEKIGKGAAIVAIIAIAAGAWVLSSKRK